jgi:putative serine protease PepD
VHGEDREGFGAPGEDGADDEGPLRGWVSPDDRLWLHPSERSAAVAAGQVASRISAAPGPQRGTWVLGGLTVCVVVTLVVGAMVVTAANDTGRASSTGVMFTGVPSTEADLSHLTDVRQMATVASSVRESTVALVVTKRGGTMVGTGVVAEAGGIVVALQPTVAGARGITVVESDGTRQPAVWVGSDPTTGIVILRIPDDLPAADFTIGDPSTGSVAVAMSEESGSSSGVPVAHLYAGSVLYAGVSAGPGEATGFCETAIAAPLSAEDLGSPLVEPSGAVAGIFDAVEGKGSRRTAMFLPAELVRDVAAQIVSNGTVDHGSLGAGFVDPSASGPGTNEDGALVVAVVSGGSADQAGLEPSDRIVSVDGAGVRSVAELDTRLYADPPGTELPVSFVRNGATFSTTVVLGDS